MTLKKKIKFTLYLVSSVLVLNVGITLQNYPIPAIGAVILFSVVIGGLGAAIENLPNA